MKLSKEVFTGFLRKISVKERVSDVVIEADGTVTVSAENAMFVVGKTEHVKFAERVALKNIGLILKVANSMTGNELNVAIEQLKLQLVTSDEKYEFRCADPTVVESLHADRGQILALKENLEGYKLDEAAVRKVQKAVANLSADRVSMFSEDGRLLAVVMDTATNSSATVDLCKYKGAELKVDFPAGIVSAVFDFVGAAGVMIFVGNKKPLFVELLEGDFVYAISTMTGGE